VTITRWSDWYQAPDEVLVYDATTATGERWGLADLDVPGDAKGVSTSGVFGDGVPAVTIDYMFEQARLGNRVSGDTWSSFLGTYQQVLPEDMVIVSNLAWDEFGGWGSGTAGKAGSRTDYISGSFPFGDPSVLHICETELWTVQGWFFPGYDIGNVNARRDATFALIDPLLGPDEYIVEYESAQAIWTSGASNPSARIISSEIDISIAGVATNTTGFTADIRLYNPAPFAVSPYVPFFDHQTFLHNHSSAAASVAVSPSTSEVVTLSVAGLPTTAPELTADQIPHGGFFPTQADVRAWLQDPAHNFSRALSVNHAGALAGAWDYQASMSRLLNQQFVNAALVASRTVLRPSAMRFLIARDIEPPLRLGQRDDTLGKVEAGARITGQPGQNPRSAQYQTAPRITPTGGNTYR